MTTTRTKIASPRKCLQQSLSTHEGDPVVDLFSIDDDTWRAELHHAAQHSDHPVVLSMMGVNRPQEGDALGTYLQVMAARERYARELTTPTVLRLAPLVEDLAVWLESLTRNESVFHAYGDRPTLWLSALDLARFVDVLSNTPSAQGQTWDLFGTSSATAADVLAHVKDLLESESSLVPLPPDVLRDQLAAIFDQRTATVVVSHQQWVGSAITAPTDRPATLASALEQTLTWRQATAALIARTA